MAAKLLVVVDLGSSESRVFWSLDKSKIVYHVFSSDCSLPTAAQVSGKLSSNSYYVEYGKAGYVVGDGVAAGFLSEDLREKFKFESAVPKVLAAIYQVLSACQATEVELTLAVLLPYSEVDSFAPLEASLRKALGKFRCNGQALALNPKRLGCYFEGAGVIKYLVELGYGYEDKRLLTVVAGYRDLSLIRSVGAREVIKGKSAQLGFLWMLKDLEAQVGSIDRLQAAKVLHQLGTERISATDCRPLSRATHMADMVAEDAKYIAKAARASRKKYLEAIANTFAKLPQHEIDEVLILGGTGAYLLPVLKEIIGDKVCFPEQIFQRVQDHLEVDRERAIRLADGYAIADLAVDKI